MVKDKNIINLSSMVSTYNPPLSKGGCEKIVPLAKSGQGCRAGTGSESQRPEASKVLQRYLLTLIADDKKL